MTLSHVRFAVRSVRRQRGGAVLAVLALGLGIGLPAAMFSVAQGFALRGLPVQGADRIMALERQPLEGHGEGWGALPRDFVAWREGQRSFSGLAAFTTGTVAVRIGDATSRFEAARVSPSAFDILRKQPVLGRVFGPGEDLPGAPRTVVIGYRLWQDAFGGAPDVVGRTILVDGESHTVIGVMPEGFRFPFSERLWLPLVLPADAATAQSPTLSVFGRLADGVDRRQALAEFAGLASRLAERFPETNRRMGVAIEPFTVRYTGETPMQQLWVILGAVLLVLVIACVNVSGLLLVRAVSRVRDLAVRMALGAGRRAIAMQMLTESAVLALAGGALGVVVAFAADAGLRRWMTGDRLPYWVDLRLDGRTLAFTVVLTLAAALLAGVLPTVKVMRADISDVLKDRARGAAQGLRLGRLMQTLVVAEIAISLGLLISTGLMVRSVRNVARVELGLPLERVATARMTLPDGWDAQRRLELLRALGSRLASAPSVQMEAFASNLPTTRAPTTRIAVEGEAYPRERDMPVARRAAVSPSFFGTFGAAPVSGRAFDSEDGPDGEPVAVVNRNAVRRWFGRADPIGRRVRLGGPDASGPWRTIVGVVPDLWAGGLDASGDRNPPAVYVPITQSPPVSLSLAVRTRASGPSGASVIRGAVAAVAPDVPVYALEGMADVVADNSWFYSFGASIVAAGGFAAVLLAMIGLYGIVSFSVGRRRREFGVRVAIGASPASIRSLVVRRGAPTLLVGAVLGVGIAVGIGRGVSSLLFLVEPGDPLVFVALTILLILVAEVATLVPAMRASRVDPMEVLRSE